MNDLVLALIVPIPGSVLCALLIQRFGASERGLLAFSYAAHVFSAFANTWLTINVLGGGDAMGYARQGEMIAAVLRHSFSSFAPEVLALLFQRDAHLPFAVAGEGSPTGSMHALAGWLSFITGGGIYTISAVLSLFAFVSKLSAYAFLRNEFPSHLRRRVLVASMLMPSVLFWTSGLVKETVALIGLGFATYGTGQFLKGRRAMGIAALFPGVLIVSFFKPYILFAFALAIGAVLYVDRATSHGRHPLKLRVFPLLFGSGLALGGVILLGQVFPKFSLDNVAESAAQLQAVGRRVTGGSSYDLGDPMARTLSGQLAFAPWALVSALFRPFLVEVRTAPMLLSALETTALLFLVIRSVSKNGIRWMWRSITSTPWLVFAVVFVIALGTPVGLSTTNLGTLSRYRAPLVPFLALLVFVLTSRVPVRRAAATPTSPERTRPGAGALDGAFTKQELG